MSDVLDPRMVFDRLIVGTGNRLAAAAARRAAEAPGRSYNPLVIHGAPGLGKTHLLTAIAHHAAQVDPELRVHIEDVESLVDRLTTSIADGSVDEFRDALGRVGLLVLDDLQQVAGMARTQEELLRALDALVLAGGQVVIASDRPPHEIPALDARLASRLSAGLTVDVTAPDETMRREILRQLVGDSDTPIERGLIEALARLPIDNVRELGGALNRILAAIEIGDAPVEAATVAALLGLEEDAVPAPADEFDTFLADISTAVAAVVETAPWRRTLADAILRWGGEGVRTRRLEEALDTDSAPDVEGLLADFGRDVIRLRQIARDLPAPPDDPELLRDPDRLAEAEALLARARRPATRPADSTPPPGPETPADPWFLDREKLAWDWVSLEDRASEVFG
jgi:chromosomal replication initiation ATPase DnaA